MRYVALRWLTYSEGGPGAYDANGNWQGETVEPGQDVSAAHLKPAQINLLLNMGAILAMPEIEVKKPVSKVKPTEVIQPNDSPEGKE